MFFKVLRSKIFEARVDLILDLIEGGTGHPDATRLRYSFEVGCNIDAIAIEIAALDA